MSSEIRDLERLSSRQLETVKKRQAREISNIENAHQEYKAELKKAHQGEVIDLQQENLRSIAKEAEKKEKVLSEIRDHLQHTQQMTDKELKELKQNLREEKDRTKDKLSLQREAVLTDHELYMAELNDRYQSKSKEVQSDGENRIERMKQEMGQRYTENETHLTQKINDQNTKFTTRFKQDAALQERMKFEQDNSFKNERMTTHQRQQLEMAKLTENHTGHIEQRDTEYRKGLKEQDQFFEQKYAVNLKSHNEELSRLDKLHEKVLSKMKKDLSAELTMTARRSDDPFYQFTELRPSMKQYPDRVEIQVQVPDHAKQDLQLTTNGKEAIVSFNRRYVDSNKTEDGLVHKVNKVESLSTRLLTEAILDPKSVKSSYADGMMTFVIKKA